MLKELKAVIPVFSIKALNLVFRAEYFALFDEKGIIISQCERKNLISNGLFIVSTRFIIRKNLLSILDTFCLTSRFYLISKIESRCF